MEIIDNQVYYSKEISMKYQWKSIGNPVKISMKYEYKSSENPVDVQ